MMITQIADWVATPQHVTIVFIVGFVLAMLALATLESVLRGEVDDTPQEW